MKNIIIAAVVVLILAGGAWYLSTLEDAAPQEEETISEDVVAVVNGEEISQEEFNVLQTQALAEQGVELSSLDEQAQADLQTQVVDVLISRTLLQQEVRESDIVVSQTELDAQLATIAARFETKEAFEAALVAQSLTEESFTEQVRSELAVQAYLNQELNLSALTVSEEEITTAYAEIEAGDEVPPLETLRPQIEELLLQQKQQEMINQFVQGLRAEAEIEILI